MHPEAYEFVADHNTDDPVTVLDLGGRSVNGSCRGLFPNAVSYTVLDAIPAWDVDIIADATSWEPDQAYDVVVCTEVLEHTPAWRQICVTATKALRPGGMLILTCAGPGRAPHSGIDGEAVREGEWYGNVDPDDLGVWLSLLSLKYEVDVHGPDVRAVAWKKAS